MDFDLTDEQKRYLYDNYVIKSANLIRKIEELTVLNASHRIIEIKANCLHIVLNDLRKDLDVRFDESDINPSVYGESGDPKP